MSSDLAAYVRSNRERFEQEFVDFLSIPSVSTEKRYAEDVERCAEWLAEIVREAGMDNVEIIPTEGNPFVVADKIVDPDAPTVLVYGHYDVQPPDPLDEWVSPPFEPQVRDGKIFARGATDEKHGEDGPAQKPGRLAQGHGQHLGHERRGQKIHTRVVPSHEVLLPTKASSTRSANCENPYTSCTG